MGYQSIPTNLFEWLLSALVFIMIILVTYTRRAWHPFATPLMAALAIRTLAALYHRFIDTLPRGGADAMSFERRAWVWSQAGCGNLGPDLNLGGSYVHSWIIANVYACTDRAPLFFQMANVALGVVTVYLVARIAQELWDREAGVRAAWIATLYPFFIINSAVPLREVWFTAFFLLSVFWLVRWVRTWRLAYLFGAAAMTLPAAIIHGLAVFALGAMGLVVLFWGLLELLRGTTRVRKGIFIGAFTMVLAGSVGLPLLLDMRFSSIGEVGELLERAETLDERAEAARGGSAYPSYLAPANDAEMLVLTPIRMVYALFGPPPWEVRAPIHALGTLDGLFYLALVILLVRYRQEWWHRREFRILVGIFLVLTIVLAWGANNFGTVGRHRAKFLGILLALAAGLIGKRRWRDARVMNLHRKTVRDSNKDYFSLAGGRHSVSLQNGRALRDGASRL